RLSVSSGALKTSAGYTVRVLSGAPTPQLKYPESFAAATAREPDSLEPAIDNESAGGEVLQNVYETLVAFPSDSESVDPLVPRLATDVPSIANNGTSADGKNYTFQLRQDVIFHDLTPMTARDVSASLRRLLAIHAPEGPPRILERLMTNLISSFADADCNPSIPGRQNCTIGDWANATFPARADVPGYMRAALPPEPSWDTRALNISTAWAVSNSTTMPTGNYSVVVQLLPVRDVLTREFMLLAGDVDSAAIDRDHQWDVMNPDGTPRSPTLRIAKDRPEFDMSFFGYNQKINASAAPNLIEVPTTFFAD